MASSMESVSIWWRHHISHGTCSISYSLALNVVHLVSIGRTVAVPITRYGTAVSVDHWNKESMRFSGIRFSGNFRNVFTVEIINICTQRVHTKMYSSLFCVCVHVRLCVCAFVWNYFTAISAAHIPMRHYRLLHYWSVVRGIHGWISLKGASNVIFDAGLEEIDIKLGV